MKILAIDPSSTRLGWAVMDGHESLIDAGLIIADEYEYGLKGKRRIRVRKLEAFERVDGVCETLSARLQLVDPDEIVIETTSGKIARRLKKYAPTGQAFYGMAIYGVYRLCTASQRPVHMVKENKWTGGVPKEKRQFAVATLFPRYNPADDAGGDIADAIGLGRWWLSQEKCP